MKVAVLDVPPFWFTKSYAGRSGGRDQIGGHGRRHGSVRRVRSVERRAVPLHHASRGTVGAADGQGERRRTGRRRAGTIVPIDGAATMGNGCPSERPAPVESITCTVAAPAVRSEAAGIAPVSAVELT